VQITHSGSPTSLCFFVQVKGTTNPKEVNECIGYSISAKKISQYMQMPNPVLFVLCSIGEIEDTDTAYFCWVREAMRDKVLAKNETKWTSQETISLTIPLNQRLSLDVFKKTIKPVVDAFALRHVRQENAHLDIVDQGRENLSSLLSSGILLEKFGLDTEDPKIVTAISFMAEGGRLQDLGLHKDAISYFRAAEQLLPYDELFLAESFSWDALGNMQDAINACERGLSHHPAHPYLLSHKGNVLFRNGQLQEAFDFHVRAARAKPKDGLLWANAGATAEYISSTLHGQDERNTLEASARLYEKAVLCSPRNDFILTDYGLVCSKLYRFPQASAILEKAITINPNNLTARRRIVRVYLSLKRYDEAQSQVNAITALGGRDRETDNLEALIVSNRSVDMKDTYAEMMRVMKDLEFEKQVSEENEPTSLTQKYQKTTEFVSVQAESQQSEVRKKLGRNDLCTCGSGKKYKKCCGT
jgi:tetratricopeptide (TPR) repeat protein